VIEALEELGEYLPDGFLVVDDEDLLDRPLERLVGALFGG